MAKHRLILVAIVVIGLFKVKIIFRSHQEQRIGPVRGADPLLRGSLTQRRHAGAARRPAPKQAPFFPSCPGLTRSPPRILAPETITSCSPHVPMAVFGSSPSMTNVLRRLHQRHFFPGSSGFVNFMPPEGKSRPGLARPAFNLRSQAMSKHRLILVTIVVMGLFKVKIIIRRH